MRRNLLEHHLNPERGRANPLSALFTQISPELEAYFGQLARQQRAERTNIPAAATSLELTPIYPSDSVSHSGVGLSRVRPVTESLRPRDRLDQPQRPREADIPLSSEARQARLEFERVLQERFADDPATLNRLLQRLDRMDQTILHRQVTTEGNREPIDRQRELAETYRQLARFGDGSAERLTYVDSQGVQRPVWTRHGLNNMIIDTVVRLDNPERMFNQGRRNCCAPESILRQDAALTPASYARLLVDASTTGQFQARDLHGRPMTVRLDRASMRLDADAQHRYWDQTNHRGAAGQIGDLAVGAYSAALMGLRMSGDQNRFIYRQDANPGRYSGTGEHFFDTYQGRDIGDHPFMTPRQIADIRQGLFGYRISDRFGQATTLVGSQFRNVPGVTVCGDGPQLAHHIQENERLGWTYSTVVTHTSHYHGHARGQGGAGGNRGGLHATSVALNENGSLRFINNWGGTGDFDQVSSNQMVAWMGMPSQHPMIRPELPRPDRIFPLPDGRREDRMIALNDPTRALATLLEFLRRRQGNDRSGDGGNQATTVDLLRQIYEANVRLAQLTELLASLPESDPRRRAIVAQSLDMQGDLGIIMHRLRTLA